MNEWALTNLRDPSIIQKGNTLEVKVETGDVINPDEAIYWIAPSAYLGNKVSELHCCASLQLILFRYSTVSLFNFVSLLHCVV